MAEPGTAEVDEMGREAIDRVRRRRQVVRPNDARRPGIHGEVRGTYDAVLVVEVGGEAEPEALLGDALDPAIEGNRPVSNLAPRVPRQVEAMGAQPVAGKPEPGVAAVDQRVGYGVGPLAVELVSKPGRVRRRRQTARVPVLFAAVVDERLKAFVAVQRRSKQRIHDEEVLAVGHRDGRELWAGEGVQGADSTPLRVVAESAAQRIDGHHLLVPAAIAAAQEKESGGSNPNVGAGEGWSVERDLSCWQLTLLHRWRIWQSIREEETPYVQSAQQVVAAFDFVHHQKNAPPKTPHTYVSAGVDYYSRQHMPLLALNPKKMNKEKSGFFLFSLSNRKKKSTIELQSEEGTHQYLQEPKVGTLQRGR
jgi:hypothetical protein